MTIRDYSVILDTVARRIVESRAKYVYPWGTVLTWGQIEDAELTLCRGFDLESFENTCPY